MADQLYALPPEEFTAARNTIAREARDAGDRDLAETIRGLRKPSSAAWLANHLVRTHPEEVEPLLQLGDALREATERLSGDDLRQLTRQRHQIVHALVQQARALGAESGHPASDDVARQLRQTFEATLADPASAQQLAAGRLSEALQYSGFGVGPGDATGSGAAGPSAYRTRSSTPRRKTEREVAKERAQAERDLTDAEAAQAQASETRAEAVRARDAARRQETDAAAEVERLRQELDRVSAAEQAAAGERKAADAGLDLAERRLRQAERRRDEARHRLDDLDHLGDG